MDVLESQITQWRAAVTRNRAVENADAEELEGHLREQIADLQLTGLSDEEAFLVAVKRLGAVDVVTAEFAREHGDRLWKQLVLVGDSTARRPLLSMLVFAAVAAVVIQIARLAGRENAPWFARDLGLFVLPVLAGYFLWVRRAPRRIAIVVLVSVVILAVLANIFPFTADSQTETLVGIHLPIVLWFVVGIAYHGSEWMSPSRRMDFVRFTGEWAIYYVLFALGGGVLIMLTSLVLAPIAPPLLNEQLFLWVVPSGATAAVIVAAWLVEAKKSVIENIAPVLTAIFTPLFAVMLVGSAVGYFFAGVGHAFDRELLVAFDVLLLVVVALVLYGISARDPMKPAGIADTIRLITVIAALVLDLLVLGSMLSRIGDYGFTPNRVAALAVNVLLVVNLGGTAWLTARAVAGRGAVVRLDRWQTSYLLAFGAWGLAAVIVLPLVFAFA